MISYLVISIICSPYIDLRYLMPIIPLIFCTLIYFFYDMLQDIINIKKTFYTILIISICFVISVIPKLSNNAYTYKGQKEVLNYLETKLKNKPMIYIYEALSAQYNKTMECYEALTKMENTYIMEKDTFSINNIKEVINSIDTTNGIVIMLHYEYRNDILEKMYNGGLYAHAKYAGKLGRFVIYELYK